MYELSSLKRLIVLSGSEKEKNYEGIEKINADIYE